VAKHLLLIGRSLLTGDVLVMVHGKAFDTFRHSSMLHKLNNSASRTTCIIGSLTILTVTVTAQCTVARNQR